MAKVLITGGTGTIGSRLVKLLRNNGYEVSLVSRNPDEKKDENVFAWDPEKRFIDPKALQGVESIIHLAGAGIADKPWSEYRKRVILESRVDSAELLLSECKKQNIRLRNFISASAIGWYPLIISDLIFDENSPNGTGFLAEVCRQWEEAADSFNDVAENVAKIRIGLVLSKGEGALKEISLPVKYYVAAGLGKGTQSMAWIHIHDVCRAFHHILENDLNGVYNAVGPDVINNNDFMQILADVMDRPLMLPNIPEFVIRLLFGEKADLILKGVMLSSKKIQETGFAFDYPTLNSALMHIYSEGHSN
ncbi:MAG: TIGR01777 family oxidoreductase [Salibacteraceae bacterium]